jgi:hypothetical protein
MQREFESWAEEQGACILNGLIFEDREERQKLLAAAREASRHFPFAMQINREVASFCLDVILALCLPERRAELARSLVNVLGEEDAR